MAKFLWLFLVILGLYEAYLEWVDIVKSILPYTRR